MAGATLDGAPGIGIAIVGIAGRFPGATSVDEFWENVRAGRDSIASLTDDDSRAAGVSPEVFSHPDYVPAHGVLAGADQFDAPFFGFSPREAALTDPQQRVFLECAWTALEHAGVRADAYPGRIGVYAGAGWSSYLIMNLASDPDLLGSEAGHQALLANDKDHLSTRVSYKLDLRGPSVTVQTGCSSSLAAVALACDALLHFHCDVALAGGVSILVPHAGHRYRAGSVLSPDGRCRAFDRDARGIVLGSGAGVVVLKRLDTALVDGDTIFAVIRAAAVNNDGAQKPGYTAPSVDGQAEVILEAQAIAGVTADSIGYVEAHGTGTALGDPIEVAALTAAFREHTDRTGFCALGSVKSNIGHLDAAAGIAGLIKAVLAIDRGEIPPSLHYTAANPEIDFAGSPFYVNTVLAPWPAGTPRRAAVSSFGLGGTNVHVILEGPPARETPDARSHEPHVLPISARTPTALDRMARNLAAHLRAHPGIDLADVAFTLQSGRALFEHRRAVVCERGDEAIEALEAGTTAPGAAEAQAGERRSLCSALASRWVSGGKVDWSVLTAHPRRRVPLPTYPFERSRHWIDAMTPSARAERDRAHEAGVAAVDAVRRGAQAVVRDLDRDAHEARRTSLNELSRLYIRSALVGLGVSTSTFDDQTLCDRVGIHPRYRPLVRAWLAHAISAGDIEKADNGLRFVAGASAPALADAVERAERALVDAPEVMRLVRTCGDALPDVLRGTRDPAELFLPLMDTEAGAAFTDPFVDQRLRAVLRGTMARIAEAAPGRSLRILEVGGGTGVGTAAILPVLPAARTVYALTDVSSRMLLRARQRFAAYPFVTYSVLNLEQPPADQGYAPGSYDVVIAVNALHVTRSLGTALDRVRSLLAPDGLLVAWEITRDAGDFAITYGLVMPPPDDPSRTQADPFLSAEGWRSVLRAEGWPLAAVEPADDILGQHVIVARAGAAGAAARAFSVPAPETPPSPARHRKREDVADWFYVPSWTRGVPVRQPPEVARRSPKRWLIVRDAAGWGSALAEHLRGHGAEVLVIDDSEPRADMAALTDALSDADERPNAVVYPWNLAPFHTDAETNETRAWPAALHRFLTVVQALTESGRGDPLTLIVLSSGVHDVTGAEPVQPAAAMILGPCRVIPLEHGAVTCRSVDIDGDWLSRPPTTPRVARLAAEMLWGGEPTVAIRAAHRWLPAVEAVRLPPVAGTSIAARAGAVYFITGGLGRIGLTLAESLARDAPATLVLVGRSPFPARDEWERLAQTHPSGDPLVRTIDVLLRIEALGSRVVVMRADVTRPDEMEAAVAAVRRNVGHVDAVIHSAGVLGSCSIQRQSLEELERVLAPKVSGTVLLESLFAPDPPERFIVFSSLSALKPGFGQATYAAASCFVDAFVHARSRGGSNRVSGVSWDVWLGGGMAYDAVAPPPLRSLRAADYAARGIVASEGVDVFRRAMASGLPHVLICTSDYLSMASTDEGDLPRTYLAALGAPAEAAPDPRPAQDTPYAEPRNVTESRIAAIWQDVLGMRDVGIDDDFFELGGDSLVATQVLGRVRAASGITLSSRCIYDHPTVREFAHMLDQQLGAGRAPASASVPRNHGK